MAAAAAAKRGEVKLVGLFESPFVMRSRIALNLKKVEYEFLEETFGTKSELLLNSNPVYKKIPVLLHNGHTICESLIIVQYVDEVWPAAVVGGAPILPSDRAVARFWSHYIDDKLFPALKEILDVDTDEERAAPGEQLVAGLLLLEEVFGKCSMGKGFFGGDAVGYLDIALGCYVGWLRAAGRLAGATYLDAGRTPLLAAWADRFCADDAVKDVMPEPDWLVDFSVKLRALWKTGKLPPAAAPPAN